MENSTRQLEQLHAQRASEWVETLRNPTPADEAAFVTWLKESPRNVRDFLAMFALDRALDDLDPERRHEVATLLAQVDPQVVTIFQPRAAPGSAAGRRRRKWWLATAVSVLIAAIVGWTMHARSGWKEFDTTVGEQRAFELDDGSVIQMNTRSRIAVRFGEEARQVRLLVGEVLFRVHQDASRPFLVDAGDGVVQATGTEFNVYKRVDGSGTVVSVLEGSVKVTPDTRLGAGELALPKATPSGEELPHDTRSRSVRASEEAQITRAGVVSVREVTNVSESVAWRERRLIFRKQTLQHIVEEFNRYSHRPIRLGGPEVGNRVYSGVFNADDYDSLAQVLARDSDLIVKRTDDGIVVSLRRSVPAHGT